jgi:hypothetical protein
MLHCNLNSASTVKAWPVATPPHKDIPMRINMLTIAAVLGLAISSPAMADGLKPAQSQGINLGAMAGDAYYTVQQDGYHVTATLSPRDGSRTPVRFQTVLSPGQAVTFSSPRGLGEQPLSLSIQRQGERVVVTQAALTN